MRKVLADRLRSLRNERKLRQIEVAVLCDITEHAYQNYERMTREPKLEILVRIADFYGVSLDYLTGRTDAREINKKQSLPAAGEK